MNEIRVDYHFHPNFALYLPILGRILAEKKAKKIWKAFAEQKLSLVFVAEHVYKKPRKSFEILERNRPQESKTHLVPAVELLTKEGIDLIAFSKNKGKIYGNKKLMTPKKLNLENTIKEIEHDSEIHGIVVHPHTAGTTSIIRHTDEEKTKDAIRRLGFLEKHNCSFSLIIKVFKKTGLNKILKSKFEQFTKTDSAPEKLQKEAKVLTGGSDAHHIREIGDYMVIPSGYKNDYNYLFSMATAQSRHLKTNSKKSILTTLRSGLTTFIEFMIKRLHLYKIDNYEQAES